MTEDQMIETMEWYEARAIKQLKIRLIEKWRRRILKDREWAEIERLRNVEETKGCTLSALYFKLYS